MQLQEKHKQAVVQKIMAAWKGTKECQVCGEQKWALGDRLYSVSEMGPEDASSRQLYPVVMLTCTQCGLSLFFNAVSLGFSFSARDKNNESPVQ